MKRKKFKDLTPSQQKRVRRQALAQSYYKRADTLEVTVVARKGGTFRVIVEALPSTAHPNIMGILTAKKAKAQAYIAVIKDIADSMGITYKEVFVS